MKEYSSAYTREIYSCYNVLVCLIVYYSLVKIGILFQSVKVVLTFKGS